MCIDFVGLFVIVVVVCIGVEVCEFCWYVEEFGELCGCFGVCVDCVDGVVLYGCCYFWCGGCCVVVEWCVQCWYVWCVQYECIVVECWMDQCEMWMCVLCEYLFVWIGDQLVVVVGEVCFKQLCVCECDVGVGFDWVDEEFGDGWYDVG